MSKSESTEKIGWAALFDGASAEQIQVTVVGLAQRILATCVGLILLLAVAVFAACNPEPSLFQMAIIGYLLSFALGLLAFLLTGFIELENSFESNGSKAGLKATAGAAIFAITLGVWFGLPIGPGIDGVMKINEKFVQQKLEI